MIDPFGGTGTVAAIARRHGRHFVHMDISKKYSAIAAERVAAETRPLLEEVTPKDGEDSQEEQLLDEGPSFRGSSTRFKKA